jgi:hypothetical protein
VPLRELENRELSILKKLVQPTDIRLVMCLLKIVRCPRVSPTIPGKVRKLAIEDSIIGLEG